MLSPPLALESQCTHVITCLSCAGAQSRHCIFCQHVAPTPACTPLGNRLKFLFFVLLLPVCSLSVSLRNAFLKKTTWIAEARVQRIMHAPQACPFRAQLPVRTAPIYLAFSSLSRAIDPPRRLLLAVSPTAAPAATMVGRPSSMQQQQAEEGRRANRN